MNIFDLQATIGLNSEQFLSGVSEASSAFDGLGAAVSKGASIIKSGFLAVSSAAVAAGGAVVKNAMDAAYAADDLNTLSKQTGIATDTLQKFQYASDMIDVPLETLTGSLTKLTKNMAAAKNGTDTAVNAFDALGISVVDSTGELRDRQTVFDEAIAALGQMENEVERDAIAMDIFGRSAQDLNPLILGGADTLRELGQQAEEAGLILSQDSLDGLNTFSDAIDTAKATIQKLGTVFGTVFAEDFAVVVNEFTGYAQQLGRAFQDGGVEGLADEIGNVLSQIIDKITETLPQLVEIGLKIVTGLLDTLIDNLPKIVEAGAEIIASLIDGLAEALPELIPTIIQAAVDVAKTMVQQLPKLIEALLKLMKGIAQGIIDAIPIIVEALPEIIDAAISALVEMIPAIIECGIEIFTALVENLPAIIDGIVAAIPKIITAIIDNIDVLIPAIIDVGVKLFVALVENLPKIIQTIIEAVPKIIVGISEAFRELYPKIAQVGKDLFESLVSKGGEIKDALVSYVKGLIEALISYIKTCITSFKKVGENIVTGLWEGISSGWTWLTTKVQELVSSLVSGVKNFLGIGSPSKVFAAIGGFLVEGMEVGWASEFDSLEDEVESTLGGLSGTAKIGFDSSAIGRSSAAQITSSLTAGQGAASGPIEINLVLDGDVAARAIYDPLRRVAWQKGDSEAVYA